MSDADREVTLFVGDSTKIKGKVHVTGNDQALPASSSDPFLDVADATLFEPGGKQTLLRKLKIRRTGVTLYYFEDDVQARR